MRKSITTSYFRTTAALLVTGILLLGAVLLFFASRYFSNERQKMLLSNLESASTLLRASIQEKGYLHRTDVEAQLHFLSTSSDATLFFAKVDGEVLACSDQSPCLHKSRILPRPIVDGVLQKGIFTELGRLGELYSEDYYNAAVPVLNDSGEVLGVLFASSSARALWDFLNEMLTMFLISAGVMVFVLSIITVWLTQRLTTPLRNMADAAASYSHGDFSRRVVVQGEDEVAQLGLTFNSMAHNLEEMEESRNAFVDNIAHELRTPMTSIKGFVDGMLDGTIPPELQGKYLQIVSEEVGRLARLTRTMFNATRLDNGAVQQQPKVYDIWETLTRVAFGAEKRIAERGLRIEGLTPVRTLVYADPDMVHQVVQNILDNAIKFSYDKAPITFDVQERQNLVYVGIRNHGLGIGKEDLPHVFDRFFKADRSRGVHAEGAGLGLHICKKLINEAGGDIVVRSKPGDWTEFVFSLPAASQEKNRMAMQDRRGRRRPKPPADPLAEATAAKEPPDPEKEGDEHGTA